MRDFRSLLETENGEMGDRKIRFLKSLLYFPVPHFPLGNFLMLRNTSFKIVLGVLAVIALLGLLRYKPWQRSQSQQEAANARAHLNVGFLPVT